MYILQKTCDKSLKLFSLVMSIVKEKLFHYLTKHHAIKMDGEWKSSSMHS
jgi:hypothetical protein